MSGIKGPLVAISRMTIFIKSHHSTNNQGDWVVRLLSGIKMPAVYSVTEPHMA